MLSRVSAEIPCRATLSSRQVNRLLLLTRITSLLIADDDELERRCESCYQVRAVRFGNPPDAASGQVKRLGRIFFSWLRNPEATCGQHRSAGA